MKALKIVVFAFYMSLLVSSASGEQKEVPVKSPSLLDIPQKGLYYGFIVNHSNHFMETVIWSVKDERNIYGNIVLCPPKKSIRQNEKGLKYCSQRERTGRLPHVFPLYLRLGAYKLSIRKRDDIVNKGPPGIWKKFLVILDREYVQKSPGPFTLEIGDD